MIGRGRLFQVRRDHSTVWAQKNPLLADGEMAYEEDTRRLKIGDGALLWNALPYASEGAAIDTSEFLLQAGLDAQQRVNALREELLEGGSDTSSLIAHINSPTPHPAYDDIPDLVVIFENGLL